ncbi:LamG domain-containing protein [Streptomyces sp. NPDC051921]|uniref:LamG domain-containing protein n=1 Tax=Streptomyces sp. NPDC051921 TaxID=3155806 RepID=UPI003430ADF4
MRSPSNIMFYLRDYNSKGGNSYEMGYGGASDLPVVGDWNSNGADSVGVWRPSTHYFYLNNELTNNVADLSFVYGASGMQPLSGNWSANTGIADVSTITWHARAFDGEAWGPWSSANGAGYCAVRRDAAVPSMPDVDGDPYKQDDIYRDGISKPGTFTFTAKNTDVVGYKYVFDGSDSGTKPTVGGAPVTVDWTPTSAGLHSVRVMTYDGAGNTSAENTFTFLVHSGRVGQWSLGDPAGSKTAQDGWGNSVATPGPGVLFGLQETGAGAASSAQFDGTTGAYLETNKPVLDTARSFTVSAWVNPADLASDMTVASQSGEQEAGFTLGYEAASKAWVFSVRGADEADEATSVKSKVSVTAGTWAHLLGEYDAGAAGGPKLRLYVDANPAEELPRPSASTAMGLFQIGRTLKSGDYSAHFRGRMADVRAYNRILTSGELDAFRATKPVRKSYWDFEQTTTTAVQNVQSGGPVLNLHGPKVEWDPAADPGPMSGSVNMLLDGSDDWAETDDPVVPENSSFSVAVRARLTAPDPTKSQTVLSLPGTNTDRLVIRYDAVGQKWQMDVAASDAVDAKRTVVALPALTAASTAGSHIALTYDAVTHEARLWVDGHSIQDAVMLDESPWLSTDGLRVGHSSHAATDDHFAGAVDELRVYSGVLSQTAVTWTASLNPDPNI